MRRKGIGSSIPIRGMVTLGILGLLVAAVALSPAAAHHTPGHTKQMIKRVQRAVNNLNNLQYITSGALSVADGAGGQVEAVCPAGYVVTGGGGVTSGFDWAQVDTYPTAGVGFPPPSGFGPQGRTAWAFEGFDTGGDGLPTQIRAYAICSRVTNTGGNYTPGTIPFRGTSARGLP